MSKKAVVFDMSQKSRAHTLSLALSSTKVELSLKCLPLRGRSMGFTATNGQTSGRSDQIVPDDLGN